MRVIFYFDTKGGPLESSIAAPVFAVASFERGYHAIQTSASAVTLNRHKVGLTPEILESALMASMFGWDCPAAQEARDYVLRLEREAAVG